MKYAWLFFFAASCSFVGKVKSAQIDFSQDGAEVLFDDSTKTLPEILEGLLTLPDRTETRSFPVKAGVKYKLEIAAEVAGDFVTEVNDRAHIQTLQSFKNRLTSTYEIIFLDAKGGEIPGLGGTAPGTTPTSWGFFLTNRQQTYVSVFYPPVKAVSIKIRFQSNARSTRIASLQLAEETAEKTVNPNPDFRYGELNYTGWNPQRDGRLYTRPDGKTVLNVGYGGASPFFPLSPGTKYHVSAIGESPGIKGTVNIHYYDVAGKSIRSGFLFRPTLLGVETELTPPQGTAMARIVMYGGVILDEFKVTPAK